MVKLDPTLLRYLTKEDFRVLIAIEMGMKNHELVPGPLVSTIAHLRDGGSSKIMHNLVRHRLVAFERGKRFDGYRLTYLGYDFLALNTMRKKGAVTRVGNKIGVGKESDVFVCTGHVVDKESPNLNDMTVAFPEEEEEAEACEDGEGEELRFALKLHRLGRVCFRKVTQLRDYQSSGRKFSNWMYASRLAAVREAQFMQILHDRGFPVPALIYHNRHVVCMQLIEGTLLNNLLPEEVTDPPALFTKLIGMIVTLANDFGLVHGDFNEFNIMIRSNDGEPILIDFPQMVPINHRFAPEYFDRDVGCVVEWFRKKLDMEFDSIDIPSFSTDVDLTRQDRIALGIDFSQDDLGDDEELHEGEEEKDGGDEEEEEDDELTDLKEGTPHEEKKKKGQSTGSVCSTGTKRNRFNDSGSIISNGTGTTIEPDVIKSLLKKEINRFKKRDELKQAARSVKGDDCAVVRKRREHAFTMKDDLMGHRLDSGD